MPSGEAAAAGIVTHAWMGLDAVDLVEDDALRALLDAQLEQVRAGAEFPDGGYWTRSLGLPGGDWGEEAHWQRFVDAYADRIRARPDCGDLTAPRGPCAEEVAHLMGVAAHGMGDEVFDWLFEPNGPDRGERYLPPEFVAVGLGPGGLELQMDIVAVVRHGRPTGPTPPLPSPEDVLAAFRAVGRDDIRAETFEDGETGLDVERAVTELFAPTHIDALEAAMPWTSSNLTSAAGGVDFAARAIAGYYDSVWDRLLGRPHRTRVTATAPAAGQLGVPARGWERSYEPGSNDSGGGADTRIAAALSTSTPYVADATDPSHVPAELPAGAMTLRSRDSGRLVAPMAGYPRVVPYTPDPGEHLVAFQPAQDLRPCTWYRVDVTPALLDARGEPVAPTSWTFRTDRGGRSRTACPRR